MDQGPIAPNGQIGEVERKGKREEPFDFAEHRRTAVEEYLRVRPQYQDFANAVRAILVQALMAKDIAVNSIEARAKEPESFGSKAEAHSENDPGVPKYRRPLQEITDLAGVRIITFFPPHCGKCWRLHPRRVRGS